MLFISELIANNGGIFLIVLQPEVPQLRWLSVKIIGSQTDCYVKLWLPTASRQEAKTRTVHNCRNPVWNETFHFVIQSEVKVGSVTVSRVPEYVIYILLCLSAQNILELTVCDEDTFTPDDHLMTVRFDVAKIQPGEKVHLSFELNPEEIDRAGVGTNLSRFPGSRSYPLASSSLGLSPLSFTGDFGQFFQITCSLNEAFNSLSEEE
ncbi:hypothetical protein EK904_009489 [Melospiza melodia maxima]|nr:hypothetical protein EK904_009489 [Melospiza melodia maxima]